MESVTEFLARLRAISSPNAFNPYTDICPTWDHADAPVIRQQNLLGVLYACMEHGVRELWIGRDLGYLGGRRTGIALTDEFSLNLCAEVFKTPPLQKATVGRPTREATASEIWKIIPQLEKPAFPWNVFPLHPHAAGNAASNRAHSAAERKMGLEVLRELIHLLRPKELLAIGQVAYDAVKVFGIPVERVRHPSYGGNIEFRESVRKRYQVAPAETD